MKERTKVMLTHPTLDQMHALAGRVFKPRIWGGSPLRPKRGPCLAIDFVITGRHLKQRPDRYERQTIDWLH
jgi:hypothetical protein